LGLERSEKDEGPKTNEQKSAMVVQKKNCEHGAGHGVVYSGGRARTSVGNN